MLVFRGPVAAPQNFFATICRNASLGNPRGVSQSGATLRASPRAGALSDHGRLACAWYALAHACVNRLCLSRCVACIAGI